MLYCTQCGARVAPTHKFCAACGARIEALPAEGIGDPHTRSASPGPVSQALPDRPQPQDWRETTDYRIVLSHPDVKALIAEAAKANRQGMTAEKFLDTASPLLKATGASPEATKLIAEYVPALYAKLGMKTGKEARNGYASSYGRTLAAIFCSLASRNQPLIAIHDGADGCIVQADIPSSMTTWKGTLTLIVERRPEGTLVTSAASFGGQAADWGRSKRLLEELHQDILNYRTLQP